MYYNKKRTKTIALLGMILLLGVCGCNTEASVQEEQKQENISGTVTEAVVQEPVGITQVVTEEEAGTTGETKTTDAVEAQLSDIGKEESADTEDTKEAESIDTEDTEPVKTEEPEVTDVLKEMEPEELVLHVLTNAEGVYFTSGGVESTELKGYAEEKDVAYFVMKKQNGYGRTHEEVHIGILNPETGELIQHQSYGNTTSDGVMIEKETGLYILYATECTDFGLHSGYGGVLLAKDGILTQVWPVTQDRVYDDDYWNQHTARLNGEMFEIYKVIVTEVSPGDTAIRTEVELERTVTLDEVLAGAV